MVVVLQRPSFAEASEGNRHSPLLGATAVGGARRDRTDDLMLAKHALYQLSYGPRLRQGFGGLTPP